MKSNTPMQLRTRAIRFFILLAILLLTFTPAVALADGGDGDPLTVINNLSNLVFGIITAVGVIASGFGIVQFAISFQSHDPSQRSQGILILVGGLLMIFAHSILHIIGAV